MATAFSPANNVTVTSAANFIPEIWSDEIVAAYKRNLVAANVVKKMNFKGKKGDTVHIPSPTRGSASAKGATNAVTLIVNNEGEVQISINKHYEYSRLIEDIVEAQALSSLRSFYTEDAGYALAKQVDTDLIQLGRTANGGAAGARYDTGYVGGDGTTTFDYTANTNTGNASALTDAAIRRTIQRLDDSDVPMDGRFFIIPPSSRNTLMGLARYTEQAFVGDAGNGNTIRNGEIGNLYGMPVFVSSNADSASATAAYPTSGTAIARVCLMGHRDAMVLVEQMAIRSQTQYKQEYLGTLFTADTLYGVGELRDYAAFALVVPA
jgi:N4-gp56 family major capsid protein